MSLFNFLSAKTLLLISILLLSACNDGHHHGHSDHDYLIVQFDMVDTDGTNSNFESVDDLNISPYVNDGYFELFWETLAYSSYNVDVRVNTRPSLVGSQHIYTATCGIRHPCDDTPILYCEYQTDFDIACEGHFGNPQIANIGHLLSNIPQELYFILDVCDNDTGFCDFQALPVVME